MDWCDCGHEVIPLELRNASVKIQGIKMMSELLRWISMLYTVTKSLVHCTLIYCITAHITIYICKVRRKVVLIVSHNIIVVVMNFPCLHTLQFTHNACTVQGIVDFS